MGAAPSQQPPPNQFFPSINFQHLCKRFHYSAKRMSEDEKKTREHTAIDDYRLYESVPGICPNRHPVPDGASTPIAKRNASTYSSKNTRPCGLTLKSPLNAMWFINAENNQKHLKILNWT
jgi:hypothetical protein